MRLLAIASAVLAALTAMPAAASAPAPLRATVSPRTAVLAEGSAWTPTVTVRRAGRPAAGVRVLVVVSGPAATRSVRAAPTSRRGVYRARVVLPAAGRWTYAVRVTTRTLARGALTVRAARPALTNAADVAVEPSGAVLVVDLSGRVYRADASGSLALVAGNGNAGSTGDGGPATRASIGFPVEVAIDPRGGFAIVHGEAHIRHVSPGGTITALARGLSQPTALAYDATGNLYVSLLTGRVLRIDAATGVQTTLAGVGGEGYGGDGGPASQAVLNRPHGLAVGADGSVYFADTFNHRVRRVSAAGSITTVAGTGEAGSAGAGGPGVSAQLNLPVDVAYAPDGSLWIADGGSNRVVRLRPDGVAVSVGSGLESPQGIAVEPSGTVLITERERARVRRIDPTTGTVTLFVG